MRHALRLAHHLAVHGETAMKKTALMLIVCLLFAFVLPAQAVTLRLTAQSSDLLPAPALVALQTLLEKTAFSVDAQGAALLHDGKPLLWASTEGRIGSESTAAPLALPAKSSKTPAETVSALAELLQEFEKPQQSQLDLKEAGACSRQLVYALTGEDWLRHRDAIADILAACVPAFDVLRSAEITGKGTFKRYLDREGSDIGFYFYAAEFSLNGVTREIRLEFARREGRGALFTFRCPDKKQSTNLRISLHLRERDNAYTLNGDVRFTKNKNTDTLSVSGSKGSLSLSFEDAKLELSGMTDRGFGCTFMQNARSALVGTVEITAGGAPLAFPQAEVTDMNAVTAALSRSLSGIFSTLPQELSLIHI